MLLPFVLFGGPLVLHGGDPVSWSTWTLDPSLIAGLFIAAAGYLYGINRVRLPGERLDRTRAVFYFSGCLVLFLALASPLDEGADRLLSLHMVQHVVLASVGPPLLLLGLPATLVRRVLGRGIVFRGVQNLTQPFFAATVFILDMWLWHAPPAYELTLNNLPVHIFMHLVLIGTGLLFWWPVVAPLPEMSRIGAPGRLLYLFVTGMPMGILALLLLSAPTVIYGFYATGPRLWGVDPLTDQQMAGVIMGGVGEMTSFVAFSLLFWRVMGADDAGPDVPARVAEGQYP